jgi:hypothetical protein
MKLTDKVKTRQRALRGNKKKKSRRSLVLLGLLAVISCLVYFRFIEPRLDARKFKDSLKEFGAPELEIPREAAVTVEEIPYRTGKVLVVIPEHTLMMLLAPETIPPQIHPAWFKLKSSIRASVAAAHRLHIDVYNWHNETYIGRWTLDPGYFSGDIMTSEELDKMTKATNNSAVLKFIESMPERRSYLIRPLINSSRPTSLGSLPCLSRA